MIHHDPLTAKQLQSTTHPWRSQSRRCKHITGGWRAAKHASSTSILCPQVWEVRSKKLKLDLPGHADEVYAVDWSPDGSMVASGGKDRMVKLWKS